MADRKEPPQLIPPHGGYRELQSYQMSEIIYDATIIFCNRFIDRRSRTHDQMVQAARSGKQNIAEGSMASGTSKKPNSNSLAWRGLALKNCSSIFRIICARRGCPFGQRIIQKPMKSESSVIIKIGLI